ncbi:MAG: hypothetical protein ABH878_07200 [bacterium]
MLSSENPLFWQNELRVPYFLRSCGDVRGKLIVDLGCGWGFLTNSLALAGAFVCGLDVLREAMLICGRQIKRFLLR